MTQMHALPDSRQAPCTSERASCVWRFVGLLMLWRYGRRGAIKPPLNWNRANSLWYRWRYRCWQIEENLYRLTGLPDEWWASVRGPNNSDVEQE